MGCDKGRAVLGTGLRDDALLGTVPALKLERTTLRRIATVAVSGPRPEGPNCGFAKPALQRLGRRPRTDLAHRARERERLRCHANAEDGDHPQHLLQRLVRDDAMDARAYRKRAALNTAPWGAWHITDRRRHVPVAQTFVRMTTGFGRHAAQASSGSVVSIASPSVSNAGAISSSGTQA